jgi:hypothetical protein
MPPHRFSNIKDLHSAWSISGADGSIQNNVQPKRWPKVGANPLILPSLIRPSIPPRTTLFRDLLRQLGACRVRGEAESTNKNTFAKASFACRFCVDRRVKFLRSRSRQTLIPMQFSAGKSTLADTDSSASSRRAITPKRPIARTFRSKTDQAAYALTTLTPVSVFSNLNDDPSVLGTKVLFHSNLKSDNRSKYF